MLIERNNPHGGYIDAAGNSDKNDRSSSSTNPAGKLADIHAPDRPLDFSANINPLDMPDSVRAALHTAVDECTGYPDLYCLALRERIAEAESVGVDNILCGNGASELIYSYAFALAGERRAYQCNPTAAVGQRANICKPAPNQCKSALVVSPTFCEYETALRAAGIDIERYMLRESDGFRLTDDILSLDFTRCSALFVCSPNNPTGITVEPRLLYALAERSERLFCDICFLDLTETPELYDIPRIVRDYSNVTLLRAFTKSYAMAGVRLGYTLCGDRDFLVEMSRYASCWNVSTLAQTAGIAALDCDGWLDDSVRYISNERARLAGELSALGIKVYPGEASYLLLYSELPLAELLRERGIIVRDCSNYPGLDGRYLRIAVRTRDENSRLIAAMREIIIG